MKRLFSKANFYFKKCVSFTTSNFNEEVRANQDNKYPFLSLIVNNSQDFLVLYDKLAEKNPEELENKLNEIFPRFQYIEKGLEKQFNTLENLQEHINKSPSFCDTWINKIFTVHEWQQDILNYNYNSVYDINNQKVLEQIALNDENHNIRERAVIRLKNYDILEQIALNDKNYKVRLAVIRKLKDQKDQKLLEQMALNDEDFSVRKSAIRKLTNQNILEKISLDDNEYTHVRIEAIRKLTDQNILEQIAYPDKGNLVYDDARLRLEEIKNDRQ